MSTKQVEILFICGSPRAHTSEALLALLEQGARDAGARSRRFLLSQKYIAPCTGCGGCEETGSCVLADKDSPLFAEDDYAELIEALSFADALAVISPLFFAGPPAQLKALFDRMQPFWSQRYLLGQKPPAKRPAQIFILGGGGDTHGYEPVVTISRSALSVAGFSIEKVQNFIGFKRPRDVATLPTQEEEAAMALGELAHLRKAAAMQQEFEVRAVAAGGAFARFVSKSMVKLELQAELQQVEAEMAELKADAPSVVSAFSEQTNTFIGTEPVKIVNQVDSEFEALKQTARAAKSSKANQVQLNAAIEEAVAALARSSEETEVEPSKDAADETLSDDLSEATDSAPDATQKSDADASVAGDTDESLADAAGEVLVSGDDEPLVDGDDEPLADVESEALADAPDESLSADSPKK